MIIGTKAKNINKDNLAKITKGWRRRSKMTSSPFSSPSKELSDFLKMEKIDFILRYQVVYINIAQK